MLYLQFHKAPYLGAHQTGSRPIDSKPLLLKIESGKGDRHRYAMLADDLLILLREWRTFGRQQSMSTVDLIRNVWFQVSAQSLQSGTPRGGVL